MDFTNLEARALKNFVTSAEDPIYALKAEIPPEIFGAFGSYFSRNPKDLRVHLLDAIKGTVEDETLERGARLLPKPIQNGMVYVSNQARLLRLAHGLYSNPADAIKKGLAKSQDFFKKWYGKYSHKSIANTVFIPMVATNVSQLFARELAYEQLAFFIEQSTRYVEWDSNSMFHDQEIMESEHASVFERAISELTNSYHAINNAATEHYEREIPFGTWLSWQTDRVKESNERNQRRKYEREIKGAALDVARFMLPQAARTNIAWIADARSTEFDIASWKGHPLREMTEAAMLIEKHAGEIAPSLLKYTETNSHYGEQHKRFGGEFDAVEARPFRKGVDIISSESDSLNKSTAHLLKRYSTGGTFMQRYEQAISMSFNEKISMLERITKDRGSHDEWVEVEEDFDLTKISFTIRTDLGAIRDWRRHQKWDRGEALYTLDNGVHKPEIIEEIGEEASETFDRAMEIAHEAETQIRTDFPFQSQYVVPMATMHELTMSGGLDQLQYMLWTRSTPEGNFSYREDAFNLAESVLNVHPWLLGYREFPKEKPLEQVFEKAPLKNVLRLQFGETALHT